MYSISHFIILHYKKVLLLATMTPKRKRPVHKVSELSPNCQKLYNEYKRSKKQNFALRAKRSLQFCKKQSFEKLTKNMSEFSKKMFWMQIKCSAKKQKARRFTLEEKIISLSILKQSPKCYNFLKKIFILPSKTTLKKLVANLNIEPGINSQVIELLKEEVSKKNMYNFSYIFSL